MGWCGFGISVSKTLIRTKCQLGGFYAECISGRNGSGTIFFIDEENAFIHTEEFAASVKNSDNYYVLVTRENLYNLPYSVEEIYGIHCSGKYHDTRRMYQQMYQIYSNYQNFPVVPENAGAY